MFNWDDGEIWVHSITHRPALGVVSGALFLIGIVLLLIRYLRKRHWLDLFLLLSIPLLAMPSILSLAFPGENPALNRAGGAYVTAFVIAGLALEDRKKERERLRPAEGWTDVLMPGLPSPVYEGLRFGLPAPRQLLKR